MAPIIATNAPEPDRPKPISEPDAEVDEVPGTAPTSEAAAASSSSTAPSPTETAEQIVARVRPTLFPTLPPLAHGSEPGSLDSLAV